MRTLISFIALVFASFTMGAQSLSPEVIASAGETFTGTQVSLEWTVGELSTESYVGNIVLTQGFHQPTVKSTSIRDFASSLGEIKVLPNPTTGILHIRREKGEALHMVLLDMKGSTLLRKTAAFSHSTLDLSQLLPGIYVLRMSDGNGTVKSVRIKKM